MDYVQQRVAQVASSTDLSAKSAPSPFPLPNQSHQKTNPTATVIAPS